MAGRATELVDVGLKSGRRGDLQSAHRSLGHQEGVGDAVGQDDKRAWTGRPAAVAAFNGHRVVEEIERFVLLVAAVKEWDVVTTAAATELTLKASDKVAAARMLQVTRALRF